MDKKIRLNLGCGTKKLEDYINIDIRSDVEPNIVTDCRKLSPIANGTVDKIVAIDLLEHFSYTEVKSVLKVWKKKLKVNGVMIIRVPNIKKIANKVDKLIEEKKFERISALVYGKQTYKENFHKAAFSKEYFEYLGKKFNLKIDEVKDIETSNNITVTFRKVGE